MFHRTTALALISSSTQTSRKLSTLGTDSRWQRSDLPSTVSLAAFRSSIYRVAGSVQNFHLPRRWPCPELPSTVSMAAFRPSIYRVGGSIQTFHLRCRWQRSKLPSTVSLAESRTSCTVSVAVFRPSRQTRDSHRAQTD